MSNNPVKKNEWKILKEHAKEIKPQNIRDFFSNTPERFENFSISFDGIFFDYSKQHITPKTIQLLANLANACGLKSAQEKMFDGGIINPTENRPALHTALRSQKPLSVNDQNITKDVQNTLEKMKHFSELIRAGKYHGSTGKPIKRIISIGVGGSDVGPRMICHAIRSQNAFPVHFVSNIDPDDLDNSLQSCDPETTLFVVISKSFKTQETITNARNAYEWLKDNLPANTDTMLHFAAVSADKDAAMAFGIKEDNFFPIWGWVNGRFSLWSAVGLPICLCHGFSAFEDLLSGAKAADKHFQEAPFEKNIPALMGLIGVWNRNFMDYGHHAILAYAQKLQYLPPYLQQLEMESNGKTIDLDGNKITDYKTSPIVFGDIGTNGQHSFYQLLHQGSEIVPADFIGIINTDNENKIGHDLLLNNMLAQGQTMMMGNQHVESDEPFRYLEGNKPNSAILLDKLNSYNLGVLAAFYEHKCFVQGVIWNINSFDQFGVELGKTMEQKLESHDLSAADSSTKGLYSFVHK